MLLFLCIQTQRGKLVNPPPKKKKITHMRYTVEDWYNHQISNLLQKKTTKTKQ